MKRDKLKVPFFLISTFALTLKSYKILNPARGLLLVLKNDVPLHFNF